MIWAWSLGVSLQDLKLMAQGENDYAAGRTRTHAQVSKRIAKRLSTRREE